MKNIIKLVQAEVSFISFSKDHSAAAHDGATNNGKTSQGFAYLFGVSEK